MFKQTDVRAARERKGWDQQTLARLSGVNQSTISRIESGKLTNPTMATVTALEQALKVRRGSLVFGQVMKAAS